MPIDSGTSQCFINSQFKFQNCTSIVQLKVAIKKSLNLKKFIRYFPF